VKNLSKAYHSGESEADNSQTPWWVIRQIQDVANAEIIHDVCATKESAKAQTYWGKDDDSLSIKCWLEWRGYHEPFLLNSAFWMNPPFSMAKEFTDKAAEQAKLGVVTLGCVKHAPDANWFQEMEKQATVIYVPDGRIGFVKADGSAFKNGANFPICFPLWTPFNHGGQAKYVRFKREKAKYSV